jgi:hypothetical protein
LQKEKEINNSFATYWFDKNICLPYDESLFCSQTEKITKKKENWHAQQVPTEAAYPGARAR